MRACDHLPDRFNAAEWHVGRNAAQGRGQRVAIVTDEGETSYGELDLFVRRFAAALERQGIHAGERVALILPDGLLFSIAFWGAIAAGAVAVPLNTMLKPEKLAAILADCDPRLLVFDGRIVDGAAIAGAGCVCWQAAEARARAAEVPPLPAYAPTHRDAFAFFLYTSGTTGEPKGVVHLQHDMWVCSRTYGEQVLGIRMEDRCFSVAKLFFAYGLGNGQYFPFDAGASAVLLAGRPTPESVFEQVRRHRPTLFFGVPTAYAQMLAAMDRGVASDFSSVRLCASAGESLPASVFERWRGRTGLEIFDGIGSTEICHIFLSNRAGVLRAGSSGTEVTGYDVRIMPESGEDVPGEIGDLLVRGDSTMAFYWNKHEATKRTLEGEWIRTGDKYRRDPEGFYWHAGRTDDMLKVSGQWVSPVEVEAALLGHESVLECAVVGEEDGDGLVKPHAFVAPRPGVATADLARVLTDFARGRLEPYKCPRWITFLPELPRTPTGKIQRYLLRQRGADR